MYEAKVVNDINGSYLILSADNMQYREFELKMFMYNTIKGFLSFSTSRVNNILTFQYEVNEYETLFDHFCNREFVLEDIRKIFMALNEVCQYTAEYLLNPDLVILNPEHIYLNNNSLYFCYYPGNDMPFYKGIRVLMEYILEHLNHKNQEEVLRAYGIYQKILKNNFTIDSVMEEFICENAEEVKTPKEIEVVLCDDKTEEAKMINDELSQLESELIEDSKKSGKREKKKNNKTGFSIFFKKKEHVSKKNDGTRLLIAEETEYGATRLLGSSVLVNQGMGKDIVLSNFPVHIGNSMGDADGKIENIMVSRKHAIINNVGGMYYLEDCDSTNGTYVNGSRIAAFEPIEIKQGDYISFANEKYRLN